MQTAVRGSSFKRGRPNAITATDVAGSLAGRMRTLKLLPLSAAKIKIAPVSRLMDWVMQKAPSIAQFATPESLQRIDYIDLVLASGFPETRALPLRARQLQYRCGC